MTMKKLFFTIFAAGIIGFFVSAANAQMPALYGTEGSRSGMGNFPNATIDWNEVIEHTAWEEQEGKALWDKFQGKEIVCADLNDEQFGVLGEYFMGQILGNSHAAMNAMMIQAHGEDGEEQIHIVMGKRLSGCNTSAAFPVTSGGWMPMMNMMWGGWSSPFGINSTNNMMNFGFGWMFMILWWVLVIIGIVAIIKWLTSQSHNAHNYEKSARDILKERYVNGKIDKKEFEEKKKDLEREESSHSS